MTELLTLQCEKITKQSKRLTQDEINTLMQRFDNWNVIESNGEMHLRRTFDFSDFTQATQFAWEIARRADRQDHHPTITLSGNSAIVTWWTHFLNGLHKNDFIMAARTDDIFSRWELIVGARDEVNEASDESFPASDPPGW